MYVFIRPTRRVLAQCPEPSRYLKPEDLAQFAIRGGDEDIAAALGGKAPATGGLVSVKGAAGGEAGGKAGGGGASLYKKDGGKGGGKAGHIGGGKGGMKKNKYGGMPQHGGGGGERPSKKVRQ